MPKRIKAKKINPTQTRTTALSLVLALLSVVVVAVVVLSLSLRPSRHIEPGPESSPVELEQYQAETGANARYELSMDSATIQVGETALVDIWLDPQGQHVDGADIVLNFDQQRLIVEQVMIGNAFDHTRHESRGGKLEVYGWFDAVWQTFNTRKKMATVALKPNQAGTYPISIICVPGKTNDSNITYQSTDLINCSQNSGISLVVTTSGNPTAEPTSQPTARPTATARPRNTATAEPTTSSNPTARPTATPYVTATPYATATPTSGTGGNGSTDPYVTQSGCTDQAPGKPNNFKATGAGYGQVRLNWDFVAGATHYVIAYGQRWLDFDYGANVGNTDQFLVKGLKAGQPYYFVVTAVNGCAASGYAEGKAAYAGSGSGGTGGTGSSTGYSYATATPYTSTDEGYDWEDAGTTTDPEKGDETFEDPWATDNSSGFGDMGDASPSAAPYDLYPTLAPVGATPVVYTPDETEAEDKTFWDYLPWFGLGLLILLALLLVWYVRRKRNEFHYVEKSESHPLDDRPYGASPVNPSAPPVTAPKLQSEPKKDMEDDIRF